MTNLLWEVWSFRALKEYLRTDHQTLVRALERAGVPRDARIFDLNEVQAILVSFHSRQRRK